MAEVIDIAMSDDDDDILLASPPAKRKKFKCLNAECRSEEKLIKATHAVKRYYGVLPFPKKVKICAKCSAYAKIQVGAVIDSVRKGNLLLDNPVTEKRNTIILTDSESDLTDDEPDSEESILYYDPSEVYCSQDKVSDIDDTCEKFKDMLSTLCDDLGLKQQIDRGTEKINTRLMVAEEGFKTLNEEYKKIETELDNMRNNFYDTFRQEIIWLPPVEIGAPATINADVTEVLSESPLLHSQLNLPPIGLLIRLELKPNDVVYSIKYSLFAKWVQATIISCDNENPNCKMYTICYNRNMNISTAKRLVSAKNLAYFDPCHTRIPVGTRVIAKYKEEGLKPYSPGFFFVGIIAEIPTAANKYRYLIFFDDGYAQYVIHQDIRVVVESSLSPWEDVAADSREFIKDYLHTYPERPMVRLQKWNFIKTEWNGRWWKAQVLEVDGSLVKMYFPVDGRTEWIYRGSTRLSPLFNKKLNIQSHAEQPLKIIRRRTLPASKLGPVVEYINFGQDNETQQKLITTGVKASTVPTERRAVARKSTSGRPGTPPLEIQELIYQEQRGFIKRRLLKGFPQKFQPHQCASYCKPVEGPAEICSPLMKPLLRKWRREILREKKKTIIKNSVAYVAPCGRRLRSIEEIFRYLRITESDLEVDLFTFDLGVDPTNVWEPAKKNIFIIDITNGIEYIPISCVNALDDCSPMPLIYCNERQPTENVNLNLDPSFLISCNCIDDCQNKDQCECWQLTIEAARLLGQNLENIGEVGYKFRRLHEQVVTGIFECNPLCSCKKTCLNRVVQHPIRQRLQLFKTAKRGWGVRTLHDIPEGGFLCVYVGKVLSEAIANQEGKMTSGGDDYYADLDFIEVVEGMKDGYESDIENDGKEKNVERKHSDSNVSSSTTSDTESVEASSQQEIFPFSHYDVDEDFFISKKSSLNRKALEKRKPSARIKARVQQNSESKRFSKTTGNSSDENLEKSLSGSEDQENNGEEDEDDGKGSQRQPKTFEPRQMTAPPLHSDFRSARELFGRDESVYIMDAKITGNIGRYFNHSCQPNVFVQNVFVDTHDLRFPWIAFFASTRIRAGVELTWDYSYDVGSVPGKIKYCYCMAKKCRGRLL